MSNAASIPNDVLSLFASANEAYSKATPLTGEGADLFSNWPPKGDHDVSILDMDVHQGEFRQTDGRVIPCAEINFEYALLPDEKAPGYKPGTTAEPFTGARFQVVDPGQLSDEGAKTRASLDLRRLLGFLKILLGPAHTGNLQADISNCATKIKNSPHRIIVKLTIQERSAKPRKNLVDPTAPPSPGRTYKTEFIKEVLSA